MRPRPRGRGIPGGEYCAIAALTGFNEATTARSWNCPSAGLPCAHPLCFNEATTARSWNLPDAHATDRLASASMRPRPRGRGILNRSARSHMKMSRFNEATTARSWNLHRARRRRDVQNASMRPRPRGRGIAAVLLGLLPADSASMRPRPRGRGIIECRRELPTAASLQ